ncbi:unnamed protein product [Tetraodon nigroviridis]|uniref:Transcription factor HES-5 n=1 Tax=Tetraodon nigroviridis TaxID=99883 RepID=Q4S814_TETNG|nr:unnamed protein product [Tetraodon nigroviridis]
MAPCSNSYSAHPIQMSEKDTIRVSRAGDVLQEPAGLLSVCSPACALALQLRKPVVEKMRRDRINSCIDQLKVILEKEFQKQEPNSKLEKADILEMTVSFLRQQLQPGPCGGSYSQGFAHCWRESAPFLSAGSGTEVPVTSLQGPQQQQLPQAQRGGSSSPRTTTLQDSSSSSSSRGPVWRPW